MAERAVIVFQPGERVDLAQVPTEGGDATNDDAARQQLREDARRLARAQEMLMAHETHGLLVLFQGMDASGKDEAIQHVLVSVDPRGVEFKQFKRFTEKEARHDYLWRTFAALPARGQMGVFNRSYYEQVVAERVHPEQLDAQRLPPDVTENVWEKRFRQINDFERYLVENGIHVLKFFLHMSKAEQRKRLLERIDDPEKQWQFAEADVEERAHWDDYRTAYDDALTRTNTEHAPWHVLPADRAWPARAAVASVLVAKLESLHSGYPSLTDEQKEKMAKAREQLERDV